MIERGTRHWSFEETATAVIKTSSLMSKSKALSIEQTQTLWRRSRGVSKKSLDTGDRFIDGLELANAFGVSTIAGAGFAYPRLPGVGFGVITIAGSGYG